MASPALSKMDWSALYNHLAKLRAQLEKVKQRNPVDVQRFRELRNQISECITEISHFHQRAVQDQGAPRRGATAGTTSSTGAPSTGAPRTPRKRS